MKLQPVAGALTHLLRLLAVHFKKQCFKNFLYHAWRNETGDIRFIIWAKIYACMMVHLFSALLILLQWRWSANIFMQVSSSLFIFQWVHPTLPLRTTYKDASMMAPGSRTKAGSDGRARIIKRADTDFLKNEKKTKNASKHTDPTTALSFMIKATASPPTVPMWAWAVTVARMSPGNLTSSEPSGRQASSGIF